MTLSLHVKNPLWKPVPTTCSQSKIKRLIRIAENLTENLSLKRKMKSNHLDEWFNKIQNEHLQRPKKSVPDTDNRKMKYSWKCTIFLVCWRVCIYSPRRNIYQPSRLERDREKNKTLRFRPCKKDNKTIQNITTCYPILSLPMDLPTRQGDKIVLTIFHESWKNSDRRRLYRC